MSKLTLKFLGSFAQFQEVLDTVCPGGRWKINHELSEYFTWQGPKIRCWRNGTVHIQGSLVPAHLLFEKLSQAIGEMRWDEVSIPDKPDP